jgi:hypothetical protein
MARAVLRWGVWTLSERLPAAGLPVRLEGAPLDLVAEVLAEIHGGPGAHRRSRHKEGIYL